MKTKKKEQKQSFTHVIRNKVAGLQVATSGIKWVGFLSKTMGKNHKVFLKKPEKIRVTVHGNKWKTFFASWKGQLEAERDGWRNEKKNWEQLLNTAQYWLWWGMHREYHHVGESTQHSSLQVNYENCLK